MAISLANKVDNENVTGGSVSTLACAATNMTTGNLVVVGVRSRSNNPTVSDTAGNTYTQIANQSSMGATDFMTMFYSANITGHASNVVTANFGASQSYVAVLVHEYSGVNTLDQKVKQDASGTSTSVTSPTFTTTVADEVIVAMCSVDQINRTFTAGATYTLQNVAGGMAADENLIVSSIQTDKTASISQDINSLWELSVATFYQSSGSSTSSSPSSSPSPSPSRSPSASQSPSSSTSNSPSFSASLSISSSPSRSPSASVSSSPSSSQSPSSSPSVSESRSPSSSQSPSSSVSVSESRSTSLSPSVSQSRSISLSTSLSPSATPSAGVQIYTRGNYASLPANDADLETDYSAQDLTDVATNNNVRVLQAATGEHAIHQFKDNVEDAGSATLTWEGQTNTAASLSTVYLQIYNRNTTEWATVDSDNTSSANTDFTLTAQIADLTNYKDGNAMISCRVYQLAV